MFFSLIRMDLTVLETLSVLLALILIYMIALTFHEWAHAITAYKQGDLTPKIAGRLTLNPYRHLSFWGFLCFMIAGIGWAKPVPVNPIQFKHYRSGIAKVSIAGVLANFVLMIVSSFFYCLLNNLVGSINTFMWILILFFRWSMQINAFLIILNLLPIYPLDGFNFISSFLKSDNKFVQFNIRNCFKIIFTIIIVDIIIELFAGFSLLDYCLTNLSYFLYRPFELLWNLII